MYVHKRYYSCIVDHRLINVYVHSIPCLGAYGKKVLRRPDVFLPYILTYTFR